MRIVVGFFTCILSAVANIALIVLIGLEYWDASGIVLDQIRVVVGPTAQTISIPAAEELHYLDVALLLLAAWANWKAKTIGLSGWFWRWVVDFVPSAGVFVVSFVTAAVAVIALTRGFDWHRLLVAIPILAILVEAAWDVRFNHKKNLQRLANGKDVEFHEEHVETPSTSAPHPRRAVEVVLSQGSVEAIGRAVWENMPQWITDTLQAGS